VRLAGEVTLGEAGALKERLLEAIEAGSILVDCENLQAVDLAVLQVLLAAKRMALKRGRPFRMRDSADWALASCSAAAGLPEPGDWQ